jgi:LemA protein
MSTQQTLGLIIAAVLVFWSVGAYNRLVRLRTEIGRSFGVLEGQITQRHAVLQRWTDALQPVLGEAAEPVAAVRAAAEQVLIVAVQARLRPSTARVIASLRLAEDTLAAARAKLMAELPAHLQPGPAPEPPSAGRKRGGRGRHHIDAATSQLLGAFQDEFVAVGSTLALARRQFNEATDQYNEAVLQFPTVLLASVFGFRAAGSL